MPTVYRLPSIHNSLRGNVHPGSNSALDDQLNPPHILGIPIEETPKETEVVECGSEFAGGSITVKRG